MLLQNFRKCAVAGAACLHLVGVVNNGGSLAEQTGTHDRLRQCVQIVCMIDLGMTAASGAYHAQNRRRVENEFRCMENICQDRHCQEAQRKHGRKQTGKPDEKKKRERGDIPQRAAQDIVPEHENSFGNAQNAEAVYGLFARQSGFAVLQADQGHTVTVLCQRAAFFIYARIV